MNQQIAFIGGGNMASAIISGLLKQGLAASAIAVVEPLPEARAKLQSQFGLVAQAQAGEFLQQASLLIWAVKPQVFKAAALASARFVRSALHLSIAAGIRSDSIATWLASERVVRAMPNTPALIGQGMTGLYARSALSATDLQAVNELAQSMGEALWVDTEVQLEAVTALSGSGPAYVFYFMEAMITAGTEMGLRREQAQQLALATFSGASALARSSAEPPQTLRQRVTSKGGTTYAAISAMENDDVRALFIDAMLAARARAKVLGDEFAAC